MNKCELKKLLDSEWFRPDCYDLDGGLLPERLTLVNEGTRWAVYYSEHGQQTGKRYFANESEACHHLLDELRDEPSAKV